jgi:hypothetical protein
VPWKKNSGQPLATPYSAYASRRPSLRVISLTARARVRAGRHYPTDVLVGSVMGISWGLAVPLLHDVRPGVRPVEFLAAGGGVLAGTLLALSLPRRMGDAVASLQPRLVPVPRGVVVSLGSSLP